MSKERVLYFTLGPVQGFVAQARKTRDFWAGSFILSYLAGHAMMEVIKSGNKMILPRVTDTENRITDPLLAAIQETCGTEDPSVATLPNRFVARVSTDFNPALCIQAVKRAWQTIAEAVWCDYVEPVAERGQGTQKIWKRQVKNFWEINWAIGEDKDSVLLDRRKNWRSHVPLVEPGDKCTLMGNLQELSGFTRARKREEQDAFWAALREKVGGHELDEKERLSAIALIKRLFPLVAKQAIGWELFTCRRFPSTPYLAAVPWLKKVIVSCPDEARQYAVTAACLSRVKYREDPNRFSGLDDALAQYPQAREFASLDGNCFFATALANPRLWQENVAEKGATGNLRQELVKQLGHLANKVGFPASPFYALLLMDGDRMGELLRRYDPSQVSEGLGVFSGRVKKIVEKHNGVTVYAGGDDVLAMLPLEWALKAAVALRTAYSESFQDTGVDPGEATISGALIYAHYNTPLTAVVREAHRLLNDVAKTGTGRDSLAVTVWKGAGRVLFWAAPWRVIAHDRGINNIIDQMVHTFGAAGAKEHEYNPTFFHNLRARFNILADEEGNIPSEWSREDVIDLLAAEYRKNREREIDWPTARQKMERLLKICRRSWRDEKGGIHEAEGALILDGALLVKFLAQKGVER